MRVLSLVALLALTLGAREAAAQSGSYQEHEVKAAFLYNFAKFVEWPAASFPDATAPLTLCIHGPDPFGPFLDRLVQGERVGRRPLVIERSRPVERLRGCHVLFVAGSEHERYGELLDGLEGASVLTVGDRPGFLTAGGLFRFLLVDGKVRFEANLPAIERSSLTVSSKLLRVARPVQPAAGERR
ncbi:MAG TPA: YfiR family protein [Thermoanaerobaculia bacterium]|nr:YfiR family protein [Thermoanaerobaculia bacterium]